MRLRYKVSQKTIILNSLLFTLCISSCNKLVDVNSPVTSLTDKNVYNTDATAAAVLTGLYTKLSASSNSIGYGFTTLSLLASLSADELDLFSGVTNNIEIAYYKNALSTNVAGYEFWNIGYLHIFTCNSAIEGLNNSINLTPAVKQQLLGEAKFMRAFFYFYLTNLYGDVPLAVSSDYKVNSLLPRSSKDQVYQQIIADLNDAENLLGSNFVGGDALSSTVERVRPNVWAARALLARVYLYYGDYKNAETQASLVIANSSMFSLTSDLDNVFIKNSSEAIWQLQPVNAGSYSNTADATFFIIPITGPSDNYPVYLSNSLLNGFESDDMRKSHWVDSVISGGVTYYYPYKYKVNTPSASVTEYLMMLRLAEQYLIRAEARTQIDNVSGGLTDLNTIRSRAGLKPLTVSDKDALISAISKERLCELFTENGHRWLDLKRTNTVDKVMSVITPLKGGTWNPNWQLYPIFSPDIEKNKRIVQNPGY